MAKPKHPTLKSIRQGQTVYCVIDQNLMIGRKVPKYIVPYFLYSHKTPEPPWGEFISKMGVSHLRRMIQSNNNSIAKDLYYSRRRAEMELHR